MLKTDAPVVTWRSPILSLSSPCHGVVRGGYLAWNPVGRVLGHHFAPLWWGSTFYSVAWFLRTAQQPTPKCVVPEVSGGKFSEFSALLWLTFLIGKMGLESLNGRWVIR